MSVPQVSRIEVRSVLTAQRESGIPCDYTINPYRGCAFGCRYCYARRFIHEDAAKRAAWGDWVEVKKNAVDALQRESHKLYGKTVFFSSATDPYQPLELRLGLTRALLETLLLSFPARVHLQTRSPHVVRDIDLLRRFGETLTVGLSIPTDSEVVRRAFEPRAPSLLRRLRAAQSLRAAGVRITASVAPVLPCTPERLARRLAPCFERAWVGGMNFRGQDEALRGIYTARGWEQYLLPEHPERVRQALRAAGLLD